MNIDTRLKSAETKVFIVLFIVLAATVFSYHTILNDFFHGDDYVHLGWLSQAVVTPELIWRNFHSSWLDISTARFYRPLISLFMVSDYLLWQGNGLGFHITNLICHLLDTVLLYLIIVDLPRTGLDRQKSQSTKLDGVQNWALASAALFGLYPIHPEAVSWITGRVDTIVTLFALGSLWSYMRWRVSKRYGWLIASSASLILALLSKEMALVVPAIISLYEIIYTASSIDATVSFKNKMRLLFQSLLKTALFWLILAAYFLVRRLALGTFIGGYDDSLFAIPSKAMFIKNWLHSINMTLVPMNKEIFGAHNPLKIVWITLLVYSLVSSVRTLSTQAKEHRHIIFLIGWLLLSLLPVFKLFNIGDDLQGSRLIYFGSAPLCALICFGFANLGYTNINISARPLLLGRIAQYLMLSMTLSLSALMLTVNNFAWQKAGEVSHAAVQQLDQFYKTNPGDPPVYLVGLPDNIAGAYVCRNALEGITKFPQISRTVHNCFMLSSTERSFPYGFARESIANDKNSKILLWNSAQQRFDLLKLPESVRSTALSWLPLTTFEKPGKSKSLQLLVKNMPCWSTDIITLKCQTVCPAQLKGEVPISLMYINDLQKDFHLTKRVATTSQPESAQQIISFPLHSDVDWSMGGGCHQLKVLVPEQFQLKIEKLETPTLLSMMPKLSFANTANQNKLGYVQLNHQYQTCHLNFDAEQMREASNLTLEISTPNTFFDTPNSKAADNHVSITRNLQGKKGNATLSWQDFSASGIYQARLRALDLLGKPCGFAGDQIMITVSK